MCATWRRWPARIRRTCTRACDATTRRSGSRGARPRPRRSPSGSGRRGPCRCWSRTESRPDGGRPAGFAPWPALPGWSPAPSRPFSTAGPEHSQRPAAAGCDEAGNPRPRSPTVKPMTEHHLAILCRHMVEVIAIHADLSEEELGKAALDERVLAAMRRVPRHLFVPAELASLAYLDTPLPIGFDKTIS